MTLHTTRPLEVVPVEAMAEIHFDDAMEREIGDLLGRYPVPGAALLPLLWLCQRRWGWISPGVVRAVAARLELSPAFVEGVVSFYTMFLRRPPGRYLVQVCSTLSCQLCGADRLIAHLKERLGTDFGETSVDGTFTLIDVQCLGACGEAPVVQINDDFYSVSSPEELDRILDDLAAL